MKNKLNLDELQKIVRYFLEKRYSLRIDGEKNSIVIFLKTFFDNEVINIISNLEKDILKKKVYSFVEDNSIDNKIKYKKILIIPY